MKDSEKYTYAGESVYEVEKQVYPKDGELGYRASLGIFTDEHEAMDFAHPYCREFQDQNAGRINIHCYVWAVYDGVGQYIFWSSHVFSVAKEVTV